jgi:hypothetical protein
LGDRETEIPAISSLTQNVRSSKILEQMTCFSGRKRNLQHFGWLSRLPEAAG